MKKLIFATVCSLGIVACGSGSEAPTEGEPAAEAVEGEEAATSEEEAPAEEVEVAAAPASDPIYGADGLVEKCLSRVNEMTGGSVIGMRSVDQAESGVTVYVNVDGADAPWQCFGSSDGTLSEAYYGGDEGAL